MLRKYRSINSHILIIVSFMILTVISMSIVLNTKMFFGAWDAQFHIRRILALEQSIHHGNNVPLFNFNYFHGALDMVMYPYFNLYPIIWISDLIGLNVTTIYVWFMINTFISLLISFYSSYFTYHLKLTSYIFSILYSMSGYLFALYMTNMDLGAISAYTVLPLIIFGFINFLKNQEHWLEFITGISLLILSHVLSTLIVLIFIIIWALININRIRKYQFKNLIEPVILVVFITSIYWVPLIYMMATNYNNINTPSFMPLQGFKIHEFLWDSINPFPNYFGLNIFALITAVVALFYYHYFDRITKQLYVLSCLNLILCSDLVPWRLIAKFIPVIDIIQKMYRLFVIPQIILLFILALIVTQYVKSYHRLTYLLIIIMMIIQVQGQIVFIHHSMQYPIFNYKYLKKHPYERLLTKPNYRLIDYHQIKLLANHVSYKNDYFPTNLTIKQLNAIHNNLIYYDNCYSSMRLYGYNHYKFKTRYDAKQVRLPFVDFNGENIQIIIDNHLYKINNHQNQMIIHNLPSGSHSLQIITHNNLLILISTVGSIIGIFIYLKKLMVFLSLIIKRNHL